MSFFNKHNINFNVPFNPIPVNYDVGEHEGYMINLHPPDCLISAKYLDEHKRVFWSETEIIVDDDLDQYKQLDSNIRRAFDLSIMTLAVGDEVVTDQIQYDPLQWPKMVNLFFLDKAAREATHQIFYTMVLKMSDNYQLLTSNKFIKSFFSKPLDMMSAFRDSTYSDRVKKLLYLMFVQLFEKYVFSVPFLIINCLADQGQLEETGRGNLLVMRDEHIHYLHAVDLSNSMNPTQEEKVILTNYVYGIIDFGEKLFSSILSSLDSKSASAIMAYSRFTIWDLATQNNLDSLAKQYECYKNVKFECMEKSSIDEKGNLMSSRPLNYQASSDVKHFDFSVIDI